MRMKFGWVVAVMTVLVSGASQGTESVPAFHQRTVTYSDLDLSNKADAATLYERITRAAHVVCDLPKPLDALSVSRMRTCVRAARARSVSEVNAPELTRYFESRQGTPTVFAMSPWEP